MALDTKLIGQALGGGRPLDLAGAVRPAIARGEQAFAKRQFEENRRKELQAKAIAQLPQLDESQIPAQMREWATGQAAEIRQRALDVIRNKDLDPVERQLAISNAMGDINKVATQANDFKQWIAQFADTLPDDLSKLNSPELMERINDIYQGNYKVVGNEFIFNDGTVKDFNALVNTRHITRRSDAYASQLKALDEKYRKRALQGYDEKAFETEITAELANVKYTDADLASIAVDELGLPESEIKIIQDDFEDNGVLDSIDKEALIEKVKNKYKAATKTIYDNAKRLYDKKMFIGQQQAAAKNEKGLTAVQQLKEIKEQKEYADRAILASQELSKIDFNDANSISIAAGGKVVAFEPDEEGNPNPGGKTIIINDKIVIPEDMTKAQKLRKIIEARVQNKMLDQADVPNLLMSLRITGEEMASPMPTASDLLAKYSTQNK